MSTKKVTEYTGLENEEVQVTEAGEKKQAKEPVNVLDLLLGSDVGPIKQPQKEVEIHRLTELFGAPFIVVCEAITPDKYEEVQNLAVVVKGKDVELDTNLLQTFVVIEGVKDQSGKLLFKNKEILAKFKAPTPKELCKKLLLSGEIVSLYRHISDLSGFNEDAVSEIKN